MHIHPRMNTYPTLQQLFAMKIIANYFEFCNLLPVPRQTKNIDLNHDDTLAQPNVQPRACWFNTLDSHAASAHYCHPTSCFCSLHDFILSKTPSKSTTAHDAVAAALSRKHHPIFHFGAGPIQLPSDWQGLPLLLTMDATHRIIEHQSIFTQIHIQYGQVLEALSPGAKAYLIDSIPTSVLFFWEWVEF